MPNSYEITENNINSQNNIAKIERYRKKFLPEIEVLAYLDAELIYKLFGEKILNSDILDYHVVTSKKDELKDKFLCKISWNNEHHLPKIQIKVNADITEKEGKNELFHSIYINYYILDLGNFNYKFKLVDKYNYDAKLEEFSDRTIILPSRAFIEVSDQLQKRKIREVKEKFDLNLQDNAELIKDLWPALKIANEERERLNNLLARNLTKSAKFFRKIAKSLTSFWKKFTRKCQEYAEKLSKISFFEKILFCVSGIVGISIIGIGISKKERIKNIIAEPYNFVKNKVKNLRFL